MPRPNTIFRAFSLAVATSLLPGCLDFHLSRARQAFEPADRPEPAAASAPTAAPFAPVTSADAVAESRASRASADAVLRERSSYATAAAGSVCGASGQRPCLVVERIPSCDRGLVENLLAFRCEPSGPDGALARSASAVRHDLQDVLVTLGGYIGCFDAKQLERAIRKADGAYAKQLQRSSCIQRMGAIASARGFRTLTVGVSGGGAFVLGAFVDTGFAFDTSGKRAPTLYQTKAISIGFQAGAGVGVGIGLSKSSSAVDTKGSDSQGFSFEAGAGVGAGTGIWYDYDGNLDGVSVSAIAGADGKAGAYNRLTTSYYDPTGDNPMVCGGAGQRACKTWERIPSCNKGLIEDLKAGRCRTEKHFSCGGLDQTPCKLWERVPSCNRGLVEDFLAGRCMRK